MQRNGTGQGNQENLVKLINLEQAIEKFTIKEDGQTIDVDHSDPDLVNINQINLRKDFLKYFWHVISHKYFRSLSQKEHRMIQTLLEINSKRHFQSDPQPTQKQIDAAKALQRSKALTVRSSQSVITRIVKKNYFEPKGSQLNLQNLQKHYELSLSLNPMTKKYSKAKHSSKLQNRYISQTNEAFSEETLGEILLSKYLSQSPLQVEPKKKIINRRRMRTRQNSSKKRQQKVKHTRKQKSEILNLWLQKERRLLNRLNNLIPRSKGSKMKARTTFESDSSVSKKMSKRKSALLKELGGLQRQHQKQKRKNEKSLNILMTRIKDPEFGLNSKENGLQSSQKSTPVKVRTRSGRYPKYTPQKLVKKDSHIDFNIGDLSLGLESDLQNSKVQRDYLKNLINKLQKQQLADSISYLQNVSTTSDQKPCHFKVSFEEASGYQPQWLNLAAFEVLENLREKSIFQCHSHSKKTYFSQINQNFTDLRPQNTLFTNHDYRSIQRKNTQILKQDHLLICKKTQDDFGMCHHCKNIYHRQYLNQCRYKSSTMGFHTYQDMSSQFYIENPQQMKRTKWKQIMKQRQLMNMSHFQQQKDGDLQCKKKYCNWCVTKIYDMDLKALKKDQEWLCPYCQGLCFCVRCVRHDMINSFTKTFLTLDGQMDRLQQQDVFSEIYYQNMDEEDLHYNLKFTQFRNQSRQPYSPAFSRQNSITSPLESKKTQIKISKSRQRRESFLMKRKRQRNDSSNKDRRSNGHSAPKKLKKRVLRSTGRNQFCKL